MYSGLFKVDHLIGDFESGKNPYPESVKLLYNFLTNAEMEKVVKTQLNITVEVPQEPITDPNDPTSDW